MKTERWISSVDKGRGILPLNSTILQGDRHLREDFSNSELRIKNNRIQHSLRWREAYRDFNCSWWEIKENRQESDSCTAKVHHFMAPHFSFITMEFFSVCNSCLTVISERFSSDPHWKFRLTWALFWSRQKTFFSFRECNQDLVAPAPSYIPIEVVSVRIREH